MFIGLGGRWTAKPVTRAGNLIHPIENCVVYRFWWWITSRLSSNIFSHRAITETIVRLLQTLARLETGAVPIRLTTRQDSQCSNSAMHASQGHIFPWRRYITT